MIKAILCILLSFVTLSALGDEGLPESEVVLFRAHIDSMQDVDRKEWPESPLGVLVLASPTDASVSVTDVVLGALPTRKLTIRLFLSATPYGERLKDVYILTSKKKGELHVINWQYAQHGFCADDEFLRKYGILNEVKRLYETNRLRCVH